MIFFRCRLTKTKRKKGKKEEYSLCTQAQRTSRNIKEIKNVWQKHMT